MCLEIGAHAEGHTWRRYAAAKDKRGMFGIGFVPKAVVNETLERLRAALNEQRLHSHTVELGKCGGNVGKGEPARGKFSLRHTAQNHSQGLFPAACCPVAHVELRLVHPQRAVAYENGLARRA